MSKPDNASTSKPPDVRISVADFGPIASGTVEMRPLTVFVGPSNTGKTYLSILVYALHRILGGFPRLPVAHHLRHAPFIRSLQSDRSPSDAVVREPEPGDFYRILATETRSIRLSDLPESVRKSFQAKLYGPELLGENLKIELERCLDLESVSNLIRMSGRPDDLRVSIEATEEEQRLWRFLIGISGSKLAAEGRIEDVPVLPAGWSSMEPFSGLGGYLKTLQADRASGSWQGRFPGEAIMDQLMYLIAESTRAGTHYLPAARSGIMQSHRVIASSLVARPTHAGFEQLPEIPTISGVMADFMQRLILYEGDRASDEIMVELARSLENDTLAGQIRIRMPSTSGYPEFVYRPRSSKEDIRLSRASSMVSELAPIVLFLRSAVRRGDMLIIEEPEAHLHPAAQTRMAVALARLVRAGVRVVVTTHSDWLLKELGNLIREGELGAITGDTDSDTDSLSSLLNPGDVGIWLFRKHGRSASSRIEEIPFDRVEGVEPGDYEEVAEELYNRSARLQNRLADTAGEPRQVNE